ncbi:hypothetical protein Q31b_05710 [Novipirellula aureliae]|uniref:Uncharacterized protein n=1 Tax=Novipirellula aureliae TaxID=2527966 RepID=A0A5C6EDV2_9BACT|nr:hypothetical protein [Novipirellula aureliae]TWU45399.1 hypothetical protein Q31b_05710 [Novipirellula aureliae]
MPYQRCLLPHRAALLLLSLLIGLTCTSARASEPVESDEPIAISGHEISEQQARESVQWLATTAMKYIPSVFKGDKDWGDTRRVWAGVKTRLDGFKLKTHRRYRELDHGRWIQYEIVLPKGSSPKSLFTTVHRVTRTEDAQTKDTRWRIDATTETPMHFTARVQRWNYGVKLYSVTVSGKMRVRLNLVSTIGFHVDYLQIPPVLVVDPNIENAKLKLVSFEVDRVSHVGGDMAEAWGEVMQEVIVERFVEKQNDNIVTKLNKAIDKHRDDLRFGWQNIVK